MEWNHSAKLILLFIIIFNGDLIGQDVDKYFISDSIAIDTFPPPRNLDGYTVDEAVNLWWEVPLLPNDNKLFLRFVDKWKQSALEYINDNVKSIEISNNKNKWDLQALLPCKGENEYGVETDGNHIYTSNANAGNGTFYKYGIDGTLLEAITIPGCQNVRDMALNDHDNLIYGSDVGNIIWGINFDTHTIDNTIHVPLPCRAIAYDFSEIAFWCNNWNSDIYQYDMAGNLITSFPLVGIKSISGLAYEESDILTPYLWGFSQEGSNATLIQMDINNGGNQIFTIDIDPIIGGSAAPGGLFTHCGIFQNEKYTIGGIRQGEQIFGLEYAFCFGSPGISYFIPENLLGYNLYRNNQFLEYIEFDGSDTTIYWDMNIPWPDFFTYTVSALYDLTPAGLPGDTAESELSNEKEFYVGIDFILPFVEDWNTGSFDPNLWTAEEKWIIDGQYGNPSPTAMFNGSKPDSAYSFRLASHAINCRDHPGTFDPYVDGDFYLEFDIKLNDLDTNGSDKLKVEITDSLEWQTILEFADSNANFSWESHKINITEFAKGNQIKISFLAEGEGGGGNPANFNFWYIDNIQVYRECHPARDLHWVIFEQEMAWSPPLPHTISKNAGRKEFHGYNVYYEYTLLDFTTDTFYLLDQHYGSGPYTVWALYEDCEGGSNPIYGSIGIQEKQSGTEVAVYPNPANDRISIKASSNISSLKIIDINGRTLISQIPEVKQSQIISSGLPNGVYFIELIIKNEMVRKKIIIHH